MGSFYMEATQINYRRDETFKTVDQKLQELSETSAIDTDIAPVFKSTNTYAPGDMVYYRNKLYVFNVEHTGAWAAGDVTATDVTTEISSLKSGLTNVDVALSVPEGTGKNLIGMTLDRIKALNTTGTWSGNSYTINGVTFTVDTDGNGRVIGIITDGTASGGNVDFVFSDSIITEPNTDYIVTGCPNGGGASTYRIRVYENTWGQTVYDAGSGFSFNSGTYTWTGARITVYNGVNVTGKTFYPMIRLATETDPTFAPYIPSVESRIEAVESKFAKIEVDIPSSASSSNSAALPSGFNYTNTAITSVRVDLTGSGAVYFNDSAITEGVQFCILGGNVVVSTKESVNQNWLGKTATVLLQTF